MRADGGKMPHRVYSHQRQHGLRDGHRAEKVDVELALPLGKAHTFARPDHADARVIHQSEKPVSFDRVLNIRRGRGNRCRIGHIQLHGPNAVMRIEARRFRSIGNPFRCEPWPGHENPSWQGEWHRLDRCQYSRRLPARIGLCFPLPLRRQVTTEAYFWLRGNFMAKTCQNGREYPASSVKRVISGRHQSWTRWP